MSLVNRLQRMLLTPVNDVPNTSPSGITVVMPLQLPEQLQARQDLQRVFKMFVNDPSNSLATPLAFPLGQFIANVLFIYDTAPRSPYVGSVLRYSAGVPFDPGSLVIDVQFPNGRPNWGASQMIVYTVINGVPT